MEYGRMKEKKEKQEDSNKNYVNIEMKAAWNFYALCIFFFYSLQFSSLALMWFVHIIDNEQSQNESRLISVYRFFLLCCF